VAPQLAAEEESVVSKSRVEHAYTEREVRQCLEAALDEHIVGIQMSSAYALARRVGRPSMERTVRALPPPFSSSIAPFSATCFARHTH
jgi:hypothetical protein